MRKGLLGLGLVATFFSYITRPKKKRPPISNGERNIYPGTDLQAKPGDLLFTPIGKSESKFVGHVGIVNHKYEVVHSVPSGLIADSLNEYFHKFRYISVYSPIDPLSGVDAAHYVEALVDKHPSAQYRIFTSLGESHHEQYCTKIVWQAYYYGAGINLGHFSGMAKGIHPEFLKDDRYLKRKAKKL